MPADIAAAAELLWRHWQNGSRLDGLPPALRPATRKEGYAIQARLAARSARSLYGWKIAATSAAGQAHIGLSGPVAGRILAEMVVPEDGAVPLGGNAMRLAEPEFAFRLGRDLPPRALPYTMAEVMDAVATLHPAVEIPDSRFTDVATAGEAQIAADNACARHFVLGPEAPATWRDLDLAVHRVLVRVGGRYTREGIGANVLGDPRRALTWLANAQAADGVALREGQIITTGTCTAPLEIEAGDLVVADFGALGTVAARFVA
jgi:2-keto-4-pentenoate hydratase